MLTLHTVETWWFLHFQPIFLREIQHNLWFLETSKTPFLDVCLEPSSGRRHCLVIWQFEHNSATSLSWPPPPPPPPPPHTHTHTHTPIRKARGCRRRWWWGGRGVHGGWVGVPETGLPVRNSILNQDQCQVIPGEPKEDYPIYAPSFLCKLNPKNPGCPGFGK